MQIGGGFFVSRTRIGCFVPLCSICVEHEVTGQVDSFAPIWAEIG